jgi:hypothetical protein
MYGKNQLVKEMETLTFRVGLLGMRKLGDCLNLFQELSVNKILHQYFYFKRNNRSNNHHKRPYHLSCQKIQQKSNFKK